MASAEVEECQINNVDPLAVTSGPIAHDALLCKVQERRDPRTGSAAAKDLIVQAAQPAHRLRGAAMTAGPRTNSK
jgi:hypothetical protein